jgi:hypothetical protein
MQELQMMVRSAIRRSRRRRRRRRRSRQGLML